MVIDTVGAENTISDSVMILQKRGALVVVGLFREQIRIPLLPTIVNVYQCLTSLWWNYNELREVIVPANLCKVKHVHQRFSLKQINHAVELLRKGQIMGRTVIVP